MPINKQENTGDFVVVLKTDFGQITLTTDQVKEFYFIEDIFSFCVTGKITFTDRNGIFEFGPLTGNEMLSVVYGNADDKE